MTGALPKECANEEPMGRRKLDDAKVQATMRLPPEYWERADALIPYVSRRRIRTCTRTEVFREALARGMSLLEREAAREKKANSP